ncbi:MAG: chemotaxis protein CheV [Oscillospiraceae bacterium]|nr:chemotaxis protein CheV [Oscillospiraceae bacterium]
MASVDKNDKNEILLESGTNEIEIMEFTIAGNLYGINVAKVNEIILSVHVKAMPHTHPAVEGIIKPRDAVITVINLPRYLGHDGEPGEKDLFIITNFNKMTIAFRVHTVIGISRISWTDIQKPDKAISGSGESVATGIAQCNNQLVTILDFERIIAEIAPETSIQVDEIEQLGERDRNERPILIAEDSALLSKLIRDALLKAGYNNLHMFSNGLDLWEYVTKLKKANNVAGNMSLVITDIEMPQMDGHRLTKLIKSDPQLKQTPVVIFSSLITEEMRAKGRELGADEQLSKPEIGQLVSVIDELLQDA